MQGIMLPDYTFAVPKSSDDFKGAAEERHVGETMFVADIQLFFFAQLLV